MERSGPSPQDQPSAPSDAPGQPPTAPPEPDLSSGNPPAGPGAAGEALAVLTSFGRRLLVLVPVYLAGAMGLSVGFVLFGLALYLGWRRVRDEKERSLRVARRLLDDEERLTAETLYMSHRELPAWVSERRAQPSPPAPHRGQGRLAAPPAPPAPFSRDDSPLLPPLARPAPMLPRNQDLFLCALPPGHPLPPRCSWTSPFPQPLRGFPSLSCPGPPRTPHPHLKRKGSVPAVIPGDPLRPSRGRPGGLGGGGEEEGAPAPGRTLRPPDPAQADAGWRAGAPGAARATAAVPAARTPPGPAPPFSGLYTAFVQAQILISSPLSGGGEPKAFSGLSETSPLPSPSFPHCLLRPAEVPV